MKNLTLFAILLLATFPTYGADSEAASLYRDYCAACHRSDLSGGLGPSLVDNEWRHGGADEDLARVIREGVPNAGMPPFGNVLSDQQVQALVSLIRSRTPGQRPGAAGSRAADLTLEAKTMNNDLSHGVQLVVSEADPQLRYVGYFDMGDYICYDNIDLSGIQSIEIEYAKAGDIPGRFAILAYSGADASPVNLGENSTPDTGGWEQFKPLRTGFSRQLSGSHRLCFAGVHQNGIFNLNKFTLSGQPGENEGTTPFDISAEGISFRIPSNVISAAGHDFYLQQVGEAPSELWAMDFLPDGTIVATQKDGLLWLFKNGERLGPITGTPEVWHQGQGGLLDVRVHPDYADNGWLYLTYSDPDETGASGMTRVVRGQLNQHEWVNEQIIYAAPARFYTDSGYHLGSRLVFKDGDVYFSIGDRGERENAQDLTSPAGKIHRLREDGRIPEDNPFAGDGEQLASIWSYGHRNPQGMTLHPGTGAIWSTEHGPRGGDEINLIRAGLNYGWPLVTHGINYDGTIISDSPYRDGVEPPKHHWTPSIGVSNIDFYTGERFPNWRNHLLVTSLAERHLRLVRLNGERVLEDELLVGNMGRVRDVRDGPDGYPYVVLNNPNGVIYRLVPAEEL